MEEDTVLLGVGLLELFLHELNVSAIAANAMHVYDKAFITQVYGNFSLRLPLSVNSGRFAVCSQGFVPTTNR